MAKSEYKKLLCDFKTYIDTRKKHKLPFYTTCQMCDKRLELNSGLFANKNEKIICKKCYIKTVKGFYDKG